VKAAIYARFSSTLQDQRSVDDQVRICRERADREGWEVVDVFADYAISGAVRERPGLNALLARAGDFDVVLAEAIDRISRDQEDISFIHKHLKFRDCQLVTLSDGLVSEIHIGFTGTMAALFRSNLADKIRRGQKGRVAAGRIPGGLCYGYRKVVRLNSAGEVDRGLREVDDEQAEIVRRIFREHAAGQSARSIASRLNAEGIKGPRGGLWSTSQINGDAARGLGILNNEIYIGVFVYNRSRFVMDPSTRRKVARVNPRAEWVRMEMPELRIVDQDLWDRVHAGRAVREGWKPHQHRRAKRLLSGLLRCGVCGGNIIQIGTADALWACSRFRNNAACSNGRSISNARLEARVLQGLQKRLMDPELVRLFIKRVHKHLARDHAEQNAARARLERKLAETTAKVDRLVTAFANGGREFDEIRDILTAAKAERASLERELAELDAVKVIPFLPNIADEYARAVEHLSEALMGPPEARMTAMPALRSLIEAITLTPRQSGSGLDVTIDGRLASIIAMATGKPMEIEPMVMAAAVNAPMIMGKSLDGFTHNHRLTRIVV
jgi:DNA invertase Pin-like site-specific DNA recombinase